MFFYGTSEHSNGSVNSESTPIRQVQGGLSKFLGAFFG